MKLDTNLFRSDNIKVSVIIPCYNERDTIDKMIEAIRSSLLTNIEIIIVDDCSKDGTREILSDKIESWCRE